MSSISGDYTELVCDWVLMLPTPRGERCFLLERGKLPESES